MGEVRGLCKGRTARLGADCQGWEGLMPMRLSPCRFDQLSGSRPDGKPAQHVPAEIMESIKKNGVCLKGEQGPPLLAAWVHLLSHACHEQHVGGPLSGQLAGGCRGMQSTCRAAERVARHGMACE